jgi:hypothetical protein
MPGLNLRAGAGLGGVAAWKSTRGTATSSPGSSGSVTEAAFGPGFTSAGPTTADVLKPNDGFGVAFWAGVAAIGLLVFIRHSLPS